jgi:hypothetical protein
MAKKEHISAREYARRLNIDEAAVRKAISKGLITRGYDKALKKINPVVADKEWGHQHLVIKPKAGVSRAKAIEKLVAEPSKDQPAGALFEEESLDQLLTSLKITSGMQAHEAMRIREVIGAALDKKKLEEAEGKLVQREKVDKALYAAGNELKKALFNIPQRIVRDIMAAPNEVEAINIFNTELTQALNSFINLKPDFTRA